MDCVKVRWLSSALRELDGVYAYLAEKNPRAARTVFCRIEQSVDRLANHPHSGRKGTIADTREVVVTDLPYVVVYRLVRSEVQILRVLHTATNAAPIPIHGE